MTPAAKPTSELLSLGVTLVFGEKSKPAPSLVIRRLAQDLEGSNVLSSALLSEDDTAAFYVSVIGAAGKKQAGRAAIHLHFHRKPRSKPPAEMPALKRRGRTAEWLVADLREKFPKDQLALCESRISFSRIPATRAHLPIAVPVRMDGKELLLAGAEYRPAQKGIGVNGIRWLEREDEALDVWLSYVVEWKELGDKPWLSEKERATQYALALL